MLGFLILYLKGMRIMMFQLSGYYFKLFSPTLRDSMTALRGLGFGGLGFRV